MTGSEVKQLRADAQFGASCIPMLSRLECLPSLPDSIPPGWAGAGGPVGEITALGIQIRKAIHDSEAR